MAIRVTLNDIKEFAKSKDVIELKNEDDMIYITNYEKYITPFYSIGMYGINGVVIQVQTRRNSRNVGKKYVIYQDGGNLPIALH